MTVAIIAIVVLACLYAWSAMTTCSLAGFRAQASVPSQLLGADAYRTFTAALLTVPGVRLLERSDDDVLVAVMAAPSSMERGFGLFALAHRADDGVVLLGRGRLPFAPGLDGALRQLERDARMRVTYGGTR
jgi:hypothetical protein